MHTVVVGVLGSAAIAGAVRFDVRRVTRYVVITLALSVGILGGLRVLFETVLHPTFDGAAVVSALKPVLPRARRHRRADVQGRAAGVAVLEAIKATGIVRVVPPGWATALCVHEPRWRPGRASISRWPTNWPSTCRRGCNSCRPRSRTCPAPLPVGAAISAWVAWSPRPCGRRRQRSRRPTCTRASPSSCPTISAITTRHGTRSAPAKRSASASRTSRTSGGNCSNACRRPRWCQ